MGAHDVDQQTEELSKKFSLKLAEKLESGKIELKKIKEILVDFFNLLNSGADRKDVEKFIETL